MPAQDLLTNFKTQRLAKFSRDRAYRYWLLVSWNLDKPRLPVIGLNPSKADERRNDNTFTKCIGYAHKLGCGGILMLNAFAFVSTDPKGLWTTDNPIGPLNCLPNLQRWIEGCGHPPVAAWGVNAVKRDALWIDILVRNLELYCFHRTNSGHPGHPLYLPGTPKLKRWKG